MARPSTAKALAVVLGIILVPTVLLYLLILLYVSRSPVDGASRPEDLWSVKKSSSGAEGPLLSGDRLFFFDQGTTLMETDIRDGKTNPSPGLPQDPSLADQGFLIVEGDSLFFFHRALGLYRRSPGDAAWKSAVPAPPFPEGTEIESLGAFEDRAYLLVSKEAKESVQMTLWRQNAAGWEALPSWESSKPGDHDLTTIGVHRIKDDLYVFISACPSGGSCGPRSDHRPLQTLVLYSLGTRRWRETASSWGPDAVIETAASPKSYFLLGGTRLYRFDPQSGAVVVVDSLSRMFKASTYEPHINVGGDTVYVGAGNQIYFFDEESGLLVDPLPPGSGGEPVFHYYYDTANRGRVLVRGSRALIQVQMIRPGEKYESLQSGMGYFERKGGQWSQVGFLENFVMIQPLELDDRGLLYADEGSFALRPFGLKNCKTARGGGDWRDTVVRGRVLWSAPDFCRFELEYWPAYGRGKRREIVTISADASKSFPANFSGVRPGDIVTVGLQRRKGSWTSDRIFVDSRDGKSVEGQVAISHSGYTGLGAGLMALLGLGSLAWGIRNLFRNGAEAFRRMFPDEARAASANRLRTTGFALLGLALFCLVQRVGGRPYDMIEVLEGTSLRLGIFLLGFAAIYYAGAINLLTHLRRRPPCPQRP